MLPSMRVLLASQQHNAGNIAKRSFASSILAEMSRMQQASAAPGATNNGSDDCTNELEERARLFLLKSLEENEEASGKMMYSLSHAAAASVPKRRAKLPLTEMMRSQLLHAAATGKYLHSRANTVANANANAMNDENSVLEHTLEENEALHEMTALLSLDSNKDKCKGGDVMPQTLGEALQPCITQARVITETDVPFRITHVNSVWEDLCGYSSEESTGCTLEMLQGPETDRAAITALMNQLYSGEEAGCLLVNYKKCGTRFLNRLRVAPLKDEHTGQVTHFIGVLQEVNANESTSTVNLEDCVVNM
eukprot:CAMPEP_0116035150 /NCGR_PEP_ID=MMETSP0321-20121206/20128_1 /TAXON_ID=163516 /ORGANISM="Leptocylindrus danicus var. danicus, Strain B650" /LENGTH=306 /DNA_ID=CAMNT_0003511791 /DNA_START=1 /DNA_END=921 /DNA_ORIENTATION=+